MPLPKYLNSSTTTRPAEMSHCSMAEATWHWHSSLITLVYGWVSLLCLLAIEFANTSLVVHCHIAFHASSGLALQILERQDEIIGSLGGAGALAGTKSGCEGWDKWNLQIDQDDSGI